MFVSSSVEIVAVQYLDNVSSVWECTVQTVNHQGINLSLQLMDDSEE